MFDSDRLSSTAAGFGHTLPVPKHVKVPIPGLSLARLLRHEKHFDTSNGTLYSIVVLFIKESQTLRRRRTSAQSIFRTWAKYRSIPAAESVKAPMMPSGRTTTTCRDSTVKP